MIDRWDIVGAAGAGLMASGVWGLFGWAPAAVFVGALLSGLYVVRELRRNG